MKRIGFLYEKICDLDNIKLAIMKASLGKRNRNYVKRILLDLDYFALQIRELLVSQKYVPSPYTIKVIYDGARKKERRIYKPRFYPDQIIHWALMLQVEKVIMRGMYEINCGSVPGRGTSFGQKYVRHCLDSDYRGTKYCLKMDVEKFYPSINKDVLKGMFRKDIKDNKCLWLIDQIVDSGDLGLPIGNYTSQWFANYFLQGLDHFIKEMLKTKYYIRYVDDLVLLGSNKRKLHKARKEIEQYLSSIHLKLKGDWQVFRTSKRAIDFLGLKFYQDKTIMRKANSLRIRRRYKKIGKKTELNYLDACAAVSYWGWMKHSDSFRFYEKYIKCVVSISDAKRRISEYARQRLCQST